MRRVGLVYTFISFFLGSIYFLSTLGNRKCPVESSYDLSIVGLILPFDGIGRQAPWIIDSLHKKLRINWIPTDEGHVKSALYDVSPRVKDVAFNVDRTLGAVVLFTDLLTTSNREPYKKLPNGFIKIASSMFESPVIPVAWTTILNNNFDAVIVPDAWVAEIYERAGVMIPIFVLPLGIYLQDFLKQPARTKPHKPFVFGNTCTIDIRKNHILLIDAFYKAFGDSSDVQLRIHAKFADPTLVKAINEKLTKLGLKNVIIDHTILSAKDYLEYMKNIDCYVTLSQGEGYSIPPREALALGIPVILSNNTAHITLCKSGFVYAVPCPIIVKLLYSIVHTQGAYGFGCTVDDSAAALRNVFDYYERYLAQVQHAREWVKQYTAQQLSKKYLNMIKPERVLFGPSNRVTDDYVMTNSLALYGKYQAIVRTARE